MTICVKCGQDRQKIYNCEQPEAQEYCVECYTELHYYLTEPTCGE